MPRFITSSAISRLVQWLMGRPESSGCSQAMASILHRWSVVILGGAPGRGKSSRRSSTLKSFRAMGWRINHRWRQRRAVLTLIPSSLAICELFLPSAAAKMIRARRAICCGALCRLTSFSRSCRTSSVSLTSQGFGVGMTITSASQNGPILTNLGLCVKLGHRLCPVALGVSSAKPPDWNAVSFVRPCPV